jgi:hypothetical protein
MENLLGETRRRRFRGSILALVFLPLIFGAGCTKSQKVDPAAELAAEIVGTWFAYRDNVIENMWTFRQDGTCANDGWPGSPGASLPVPPYHLEGTYSVAAEEVVVVFNFAEGVNDTITLRDPEVTDDRLVYSVGGIPVAFLRERAAVGTEPTAPADSGIADPELPRALVGAWVALAGNFPTNTWKFNEDGTFINEGWARLNPEILVIKRTYQASGKYSVSGTRILLTNERITQFGSGSDGANTDIPVAEKIILYNVRVSRGRLVYSNEGGLPVAFRSGVVTPTHW